jgi:hypothetical protein
MTKYEVAWKDEDLVWHTEMFDYPGQAASRYQQLMNDGTAWNLTYEKLVTVREMVESAYSRSDEYITARRLERICKMGNLK